METAVRGQEIYEGGLDWPRILLFLMLTIVHEVVKELAKPMVVEKIRDGTDSFCGGRKKKTRKIVHSGTCSTGVVHKSEKCLDLKRANKDVAKHKLRMRCSDRETDKEDAE